MLKSYKELKVWKKAYKLTLQVYKITSDFPKSELYGLTSQMRRSALSIPTNIAEGYMRGHSKEYLQFLWIAYGSTGELETCLLISHDLGFIRDDDFGKVYSLHQEVAKMLFSLIKSIKEKITLTPNP